MRNDAENIGLIKQLISLARALIELKDPDVRLRPGTLQEYPGFMYVGSYDYDDDEAYYVNEKTGQLLRSTWSISGHNGDPYAYRFEILDAEGADIVLRNMCTAFINRGMAIERRLKEEELRKKETDELRDRFLSRVKE